MHTLPANIVAELHIEPYPPRPPSPGGQHVGIGPVGVQITHEPSGLIAISTGQRSQHRNRELALAMIEAGLCLHV